MNPEIPDSQLDAGLRLLNASDEDVLGYLGIQAERLELAEKRTAQGQAVPPWSDSEALAKVLSPQRAPREEITRYAQKGLAYAQQLLSSLADQLRSLLCDGTAVRKELKAFEGDTKELLKGVAMAVGAALIAHLPTLLAKAALSIATTIAVLLLKKRLETFCAVGPKAVT
jgi:hypothetical protein